MLYSVNFGCFKGVISGFYVRLKMGKQPTLFTTQRAQIATLCVEGYTEHDISVRSGCSKMVVHSVITRY